jgi:hypothetical protein
MANAKGTPQNLTSFSRVGKKPLGGVIPIRVDPDDEAKLRAMGGKAMQKFIRDAIAKALSEMD